MPEKNCSVLFLPANRRVDLAAGSSVIKAAREAGVHINASCGGSGVCGKCRVIIEEGEVASGLSEKFSPDEKAAGHRQACTATLTGDLVVRVPESSSLRGGGLGTAVPVRHRARLHRYDIEELREAGIFVPPITKHCLALPPPSAGDNRADAGRLIQSLAQHLGLRRVLINLPVLQGLSRVLRKEQFRVTVTIANPVNPSGRPYIIAVESGDWTGRSFGLAFDIGTTSVYGALIDRNSGTVLARHGEYNGQLCYGEDVISRIIVAEKEEGLATMQAAVVATINRIIDRLLATARPLPVGPRGACPGPEPDQRVDRREITSITVAANTSMSHLFAGIDPSGIRRAPYVPVTTFFPPIRAADLGIQLSDAAVALLYPAVSSYVGGDIVAGVMGSGMYRTELMTLYIDIGTNAEIVIGNRDWLACAACSAGPAFEGGGIGHGMRAAVGAIEDFSLDPETFEPMNVPIGNQPPVGICGSGLLAMIAIFFEQGVIDPSGRFRRDLNSERIRPGKNGYEFVLVRQQESGTDHDIVLTEVDIENFIRAKAAIHAGISTLLEQVGLTVADIEQVLLAGAFGSYIDLDAAMTVGLLPEVAPDRVLYVGNGSLLGTWMSEMSNHIRADVVEVVRRMTSFELSEVPSFHDRYVASLFLPHTDLGLFPAVAERLRRQGRHEC